MNSPALIAAYRYQAQILPGVSRTFALTIPQLPAPLDTVVANAYLLCRIADTIEDDAELDAAQKTHFSHWFTAACAGEAEAEAFSAALVPRLAPQTPADERDLIQHTPLVLRLTHSFSPAQQSHLSRCVRIMSSGMAEFQRQARPDGLQTLAELDRYCYYVAGVVGEMLAELFCDYAPQIAAHREQLLKLAVSFGQGLQMTNILKDMQDDQARGVCWLPQAVFQEFGFDLRDLAANRYQPAFADGLAVLIDQTRQHLEQALDYVLLIPAAEKGIRRFCLWALGMALLTLRRIEQRRQLGGFYSPQQVKISRREVRLVVLVSNLATGQDWLLRRLFQRLAAPLIHTGKPDRSCVP